MRPSIKALVGLNFSLAAAAGACDEVAADDVAGWSDAPVSFRDDDCVPPDCIGNSPFVGDYPWSNIRTKENASAPTPVVGVSTWSHWSTGALQRNDDTWMSFNFLVVTPEGRLYAYNSTTLGMEAIDQGKQAFVKLTIVDFSVDPVTVEDIAIWIRHSATSSPTPTFDAWKYAIAARTAPPTSDYPSAGSPPDLPGGLTPSPWSGTYYSICPVSEEESGEALFLEYVELNFEGQAAWLENAYGLGPDDFEIPSTSVIACQGHAFSKPQEFLAVTPNSYVDAGAPGERSYGLANYNALANAYRAFYAGDARTVLGTPVHFKDFAHNPPWFDQTTSAYLPSPPIIGSWQFVLESVYKDFDTNGDPLGANCYYTDANSPNGAHRLYNPPGGNANLPGWSSMTSCGATQGDWDDFGLVGAFVLKHILPGGGSS
ncbi:hypothetical protein [Nannocystis punicea]|uniref:Uncharacterized protein n=1 Tax=Nannocystis punicea TaxID=2995304 RepID=A0ABY7H8I4_9BACT|nr:hypothetical protein [Nannocystis poenicansa]WAS95551.1 hypothetical protein O0S08_05265 [Nannocystis poenicansa]